MALTPDENEIWSADSSTPLNLVSITLGVATSVSTAFARFKKAYAVARYATTGARTTDNPVPSDGQLSSVAGLVDLRRAGRWFRILDAGRGPDIIRQTITPILNVTTTAQTTASLGAWTNAADTTYRIMVDADVTETNLTGTAGFARLRIQYRLNGGTWVNIAVGTQSNGGSVNNTYAQMSTISWRGELALTTGGQSVELRAEILHLSGSATKRLDRVYATIEPFNGVSNF